MTRTVFISHYHQRIGDKLNLYHHPLTLRRGKGKALSLYCSRIVEFFCSAFDAERERQHRAKYRQMEVKKRT